MSYENDPPSREPDPLLAPPPGISLSAFFEQFPPEAGADVDVDVDAGAPAPAERGRRSRALLPAR